MLVRELKEFRDKVAIPRLLKLYENTNIPDGMCCIDNLRISFLDGRSFGTDYHIEATGLVYKDGRVEDYSYSEYDVSVADFAAIHKDCVFISDGHFSVFDELSELEVNSYIRNIGSCVGLFPELVNVNSIKVELNCIEFSKMRYLHANQSGKKLTLEDQIKLATSVGSETHPATDIKLFLDR